MRNWRRKIYPANPNTLSQFAEQLKDGRNDHLLAYNTSIMTVETLTDDDGDEHILMYDKDHILKLFTSDATKIFVDGTFQTTPNIANAYQLISIIAIRFGRVSLI